MEIKGLAEFLKAANRIPVNISGKLDQSTRLLHPFPGHLLSDSLNKVPGIGDSLEFMKNPDQPAPMISKCIARFCRQRRQGLSVDLFG